MPHKNHTHRLECAIQPQTYIQMFFQFFFQHKKCKRVAYVMWVLWWLFSSYSFSQSWKMKNSLLLKRWFVYSSVCLSDLLSVCRYDHPKVWLNFNTLYVLFCRLCYSFRCWLQFFWHFQHFQHFEEKIFLIHINFILNE